MSCVERLIKRSTKKTRSIFDFLTKTGNRQAEAVKERHEVEVVRSRRRCVRKHELYDRGVTEDRKDVSFRVRTSGGSALPFEPFELFFCFALMFFCTERIPGRLRGEALGLRKFASQKIDFVVLQL